MYIYHPKLNVYMLCNGMYFNYTTKINERDGCTYTFEKEYNSNGTFYIKLLIIPCQKDEPTYVYLCIFTDYQLFYTYDSSYAICFKDNPNYLEIDHAKIAKNREYNYEKNDFDYSDIDIHYGGYIVVDNDNWFVYYYIKEEWKDSHSPESTYCVIVEE
jgi:hypothetical protein